MVAPVTGPFNTNLSTPALYRYATGYKQARPIDRPLPFQLVLGKETAVVGGGWAYDAGAQTTAYFVQRDWQLASATNIAYDRLKGSIGSAASLGAALAEYSQSAQMIIARASQMLTFIRRLRRLDFSGAAAELRLSTIPKGVSKRRSFANNYLEFHFGWSPLIGDIYSAVDVLQNPIKSIRPKGTCTLDAPDWGYYENGGVGPIWTKRFNTRNKIRVIMGCEVTINNPNLFLANQLGLANPATVVWEVIPFSFVVDWFVNVGQVLSSGTDFLGLTVTNGYTTQFSKGQVDTYRYNIYSSPVYSGRTSDVVFVKRTLGLVAPTLKVRPWKAPHWRRAASAVALLVQAHRG